MNRSIVEPIVQSKAARAYGKLIVVAALFGVILGALIIFVNRETVNGLRHHLTLWLIVALVAIVNITSFLLFLVFRLIYRWVMLDIRPDDDE